MADINNDEVPPQPNTDHENEIPMLEDPAREQVEPEVKAQPPKRFSLPTISSKATAWDLQEELEIFLQERCSTHMTYDYGGTEQH